MKRILAVDYGKMRTGLAITDELHISLNPLQTISSSVLEAEIAKLISAYKIGTIVFGIGYHSDGSLTANSRAGQLVMNRLKAKYPGVQFEVIDESWSSVEARSLMFLSGVKKKKRASKAKLDQLSAVIILKDYLNQKHA